MGSRPLGERLDDLDTAGLLDLAAAIGDRLHLDGLLDLQERIDDLVNERLAQEDLGSNGPDLDADLLPKCEDGENCPPTNRPRGSWIDLKMIGGHGPYRYLRWREGGHCRSRCIGKVEKGK